MFRIGVNLGDVIAEGDDIFGDGVNIAARLEAWPIPAVSVSAAWSATRCATSSISAFEDLGEQQVKNIARPVRVYRIPLQRKPKPPGPRCTTAAAAARQAVDRGLPFQNMSGDPEQEYFADGMVEEIITALSRIRWLFVIARNSSFTYKGQAVDVKQVGRELGVRYVLEGSVRKGGSRVRITAQLIDARPARISGPTASTARSTTSSIFRTRSRRASPASSSRPCRLLRPRGRRPPDERSDSYDLYLRAYAMSYHRRGRSRRLCATGAGDCARSPLWAGARIGRNLLLSPADGSSEDPETDRRRASISRGGHCEVAGDDPGVLANAAFALAFFGEDIGAMIGLG